MPRACLFALVFVVACGDDDGMVPDDDPMEDSGVDADGGSTGPDGGSTDGGNTPMDGGPGATDGGPGAMDAAAPGDAGPPPDLGPSPCDGLTFGSPCTARCPSGYECVDGACLPGSMRPGCGGFAGAMCTTRAFPNCLYFDSSDYGPCLSEEELTCACEAFSDRFDCSGR